MINRLSNPINRNRSAAKISKVMSSSQDADIHCKSPLAPMFYCFVYCDLFYLSGPFASESLYQALKYNVVRAPR